MSGVLAEIYDGKAVDWTALQPDEKRLLERQLRVLAREIEMLIRGDRERAKFFQQQVETGGS